MKSMIGMSVFLAVVSVLLCCCGNGTRQVVPIVDFSAWVKEEYAKYDGNSKKDTPVKFAHSAPKQIIPEEQGMVFKDYTMSVHVFGEDDSRRRDAVIAALKKRSESGMKHHAKILFYKEYNVDGENRSYLIEEF